MKILRTSTLENMMKSIPIPLCRLTMGQGQTQADRNVLRWQLGFIKWLCHDLLTWGAPWLHW